MKPILGLLTIGTLLFACDRASELQPAIPSTLAGNAPMAVLSSMNRVFPDAKEVSFSSLETNKVWAANFKTDASYTTTLNSNGDFNTIWRQITPQNLPQLAQKFIQPDQTIRQAYQDLTDQKVAKGFVAVVSDAKGVLTTYQFSQTGQPQNTLSSGAVLAGDTLSSTPLFSYSVAAENLPEAIKTYQRTNFANFTIDQSSVMTVRGVKTFFISLTNGGSNYRQVYFDEQGNFLTFGPIGFVIGTDEIILTSNDIPQTARSQIDTYYPGWSLITAVSNNARTANSLIVRNINGMFVLFFDQSWALKAVYKQY